jgi:hypothetical protein
MNYEGLIKYTARKKINYLSNKELLKGIGLSKLSYCSFIDPKYKHYDMILSSPGEISSEIIQKAKILRANHINEKRIDALTESGMNVKDAIEQVSKTKITPKKLTRSDLCFRIMTFEHIPEEIIANPKLIFLKLYFNPFKHYSFIGNKWQEVGRSHWSGDFKTGKFDISQGKLSNSLVKSIMMLVDHYSQKGNFRNYTYIEDMKGQALLQMSQVALQFDESRGFNPFAFYTQCIKNSFIKILKNERKVRDTRDELLISHGMSASFGYENSQRDLD